MELIAIILSICLISCNESNGKENVPSSQLKRESAELKPVPKVGPNGDVVRANPEIPGRTAKSENKASKPIPKNSAPLNDDKQRKSGGSLEGEKQDDNLPEADKEMQKRLSQIDETLKKAFTERDTIYKAVGADAVTTMAKKTADELRKKAVSV